MSIVLISLFVLFCYMSMLFVLAQRAKNNGVADIGYGIGFLVISYATALQVPKLFLFQYLLLGLVTVWGVRLAVRIFLKNKGKNEDFRYNAWRQEWGKAFVVRSFFQIYMLQGSIIALIASPIILALIFGTRENLAILFFGGVFLWCVGFFFEAVGDYQLDTFIHNPINKGKIMMSGLWSYTRHPNYFGESMMWCGITLASIAITPIAILGTISPLLITFLLLKVSGVPMLEKRWEGNTQWEEYKKRTSVFIPLPQKKL